MLQLAFMVFSIWHHPLAAGSSRLVRTRELLAASSPQRRLARPIRITSARSRPPQTPLADSTYPLDVLQDCVATNFTKGALCDLVATVVLKYCQVGTTQAACSALSGCSFSASSSKCELNVNTADAALFSVAKSSGSTYAAQISTIDSQCKTYNTSAACVAAKVGNAAGRLMPLTTVVLAAWVLISFVMA